MRRAGLTAHEYRAFQKRRFISEADIPIRLEREDPEINFEPFLKWQARGLDGLPPETAARFRKQLKALKKRRNETRA
jgi:hypothetical protein